MNINLSLACCRGLSACPGEGVKQLVNIFQAAGASFLRWRGIGKDALLERDPVPANAANDEGNFSVPGQEFTHELLAPAFYGYGDVLPAVYNFGPTANLRFFQPCRIVDVDQFANEDDPQRFDDSARRIVQIGTLIYSGIRPAYGYLDAEADCTVAKYSVTKKEIRFLFWANIFGPEFVELYGREFLLNAPGWTKEERNDGGILYIATEGLSEWLWKTSPTNVIEYFRRRIPRIKVFRSQLRGAT